MKYLSVLLVAAALLGACADDDDVQAEVDGGVTVTTGDIQTDVEDAAENLEECVLEDGATVTLNQLSDEFCFLAGDTETAVGFVTYDCGDGTELYAAGESETDDDDGGWVRFDESGEGTWQSGAYGDAMDECVGDADAADGEVWTYTTRAGETLEVECDDDTACTGGVPDPVGLIDSAADNTGCSGVQSERDFWADQVDSDNSEEYQANARAYVAYAEDKLAELGC